jgi:hypothetical protein
MGRTLPSFRLAEMQEVREWRAFRRSLPKRERKRFDDMLDAARLYTSASSSALRASRFEGAGFALLFHHFKELAEISARIDDVRRSR